MNFLILISVFFSEFHQLTKQFLKEFKSYTQYFIILWFETTAIIPICLNLKRYQSLEHMLLKFFFFIFLLKKKKKKKTELKSLTSENIYDFDSHSLLFVSFVVG